MNNSILFRNLPEVNSLKSKEDVGREVDDMEKKFIGDRITELRIKKNVSEYQMSLDLGKTKVTSSPFLPGAPCLPWRTSWKSANIWK